MPEFEIEGAVSRHDIERGTAADHTGVDGCIGYVVRRIEAAAIAKAMRHMREERDDLAGDLHCVDAARCQ